MMRDRLQSRLTLAAVLTCLWPSVGCFDPLLHDPQVDDSDSAESSGSNSAGSSDGDVLEESSGDQPAVCGDGIVEGDEQCDDGLNDGSYGGCSADCSVLGPHCGDGVVNGDEPCDDGDEVDGNGCNVDCVVSGTLLWTVTYDGPDHGVDRGWGIAASADGQVFASGSTSLGLNSQGWISGYSPEGSTLWTNNLSGPSGGEASGRGVVISPSGAVIHTGRVIAADGIQDGWIRSFSATGEASWTQTYRSASSAASRGMAIGGDSMGNIYALILENSIPGETDERTVVRKFSSDGREIWTRFQDPSYHAASLTVDSDDRPVIAGSFSAGEYSMPWIKRLTSDGDDELNDIQATTSNIRFSAVSARERIAVALETGTNGMLLILDDNGVEELSFRPHIGSDIVLIHTIAINHDGSIVAAGSRATELENPEIWVSKYRADGDELWTNSHNGDEDTALAWDTANALSVDSHGNVLAIGTIHDSAAGHLGDIWIAKYAP